MRWLIIEDALRDRKGHWFEYLSTFYEGLRALGDSVEILADHRAEPHIIERLQARPVLPDSIWHRMGDGAGSFTRYARIPLHALATRRAVARWFRHQPEPDIIFVPTVLVHHLLGWTWLIKGRLRRTPARIILFFPNTPVRLDENTGAPVWVPSPTARLFCRLIRSLSSEVGQGRVILGAETKPMRDALTRLTGVPFTYFPHPVEIPHFPVPAPPSALRPPPSGLRSQVSAFENVRSPWSVVRSPPSVDCQLPTANGQLPSEPITFACYGPARQEKGSDLLVAAIEKYLQKKPDSRIKFVLQWLDDFTTAAGETSRIPLALRQDSRVEIINRFFADGEYSQRLASTQVLLLPYRRSSYALRVSRVVIEAMVNGIPVVVTRGTTLAQQAEEFGAEVLCADDKMESLVAAMETVERNYEALAALARERRAPAREHFSVAEFRRIVFSK